MIVWGVTLIVACYLCLGITYLILSIGKTDRLVHDYFNLHRETEKLKAEKDQLKTQLKNPSTELKDFMSDMQVHGCGFVRVDPDSVFLRSPRSR